MRKVVAIYVAILATAAGSAAAFDIDDLAVTATVTDTAFRNRFKIRAHVSGVDLATVGAHSMTLRFGDVVARVPENGFRRRGKNGFAWRGTALGVKRLSLNVKKSSLKVVGGGMALGDVEAPLVLAMGTGGGAMCGELTLTPTKTRARKTKLAGTGPLGPCEEGGGTTATATAPEVLITSPTAQPGTTTDAPTITIAGEAADDVGLASLAWSNDRGGSGSLPPSEVWSIPLVPLQAGDNRITVTATDTDGDVGSDVLDVVYNDDGIVFDGMPVADPGALTFGPRRLVSIGQAIAINPDLDPTSIELHAVADDGTTTLVGPMADDGNFASGDRIAGDGRYSGRASIDAAEIGTHRFRVSARTKSAPDSVAWSPTVDVEVTAPVSREALTNAIALADDAGAMLDELLAAGIGRDELLANLADLAYVHGATTIGLSPSGRSAWWLTGDGLLGGAIAVAPGDGGAAPLRARPAPRLASVPAALPAAGEAVQVGTRHALLVAPGSTDAGAAEIAAMLTGVDCPHFDVHAHTGTQAGAERFEDLDDEGIVVVASRGDVLFGGIGAAYRPEWEWHSAGAQVAVLTGTTLSPTNVGRWAQDLRLGRMAVMRGGAAAVLPAFVAHHSSGLPGSLVLLAIDNATANGTLASAFLQLGATTVLGFDGFVDPGFAHDRSIELFTALLGGATVGDVFVPGQTDGSTPPATYTMAGSPETSINTDVIVNGSFEFASGFLASVTGFDVVGDGHVVRNLGTWLPTRGERMALVSTGLGLTKAVGTFEQTVCIPPLPPGATKLTLSYDWNFFSEEFIEYCGSQFQDSFEVDFDETILQSTKIDDLCDVVVPDPIAFDRGDVYTTGWLSQAIDVTPFAGTTTSLQFGARDVGDSIYDSVILVDDVRLTFE